MSSFSLALALNPPLPVNPRVVLYLTSLSPFPQFPWASSLASFWRFVCFQDSCSSFLKRQSPNFRPLSHPPICSSRFVSVQTTATIFVDSRLSVPFSLLLTDPFFLPPCRRQVIIATSVSNFYEPSLAFSSPVASSPFPLQ